MYIKNNKLLVKKIGKKEISTSLFSDILCERDIYNLSKKEFLFILKLDNYKEFKNNIYNTNLLEDIVFDSKLFYNILELNKTDKIDKFYSLNFIQKFVYESNRAEGSEIKEEEVFKIFNNKKSSYNNKNEILEVKNSKKVFDYMNEKFIFNIVNLKRIYHILTKDLLMKSGDKYPRGFKKIENTVNNDITSSPENVEKDLIELLNWYKYNKNKIFPLELAYLFHLKFERIHPFIDGNGRIGRFLINKILIDNNYFPIILFSDNKKSFFNSIKNSGVNNKKYYKTMIEQHKKTMDYFNIN